MGLVEHAKRELELAGMFSKESDYNGMLGPAVLKMVEVFAAEGHSGFSAGMALGIFIRLAQFKTLTPLTSDPDEWADVTAYGDPAKPMWQSKRDPSFFSEDGGKTWRSVDDEGAA